MSKLSVYRDEHGTYKEAFDCGAIYSSQCDELEPEFVDAGRTLYLGDIKSIIGTVLEAAGRDDLVVGSVIHEVFWTLDELITHFNKINEWPDVNYPEKVVELAKIECKNDEVSYDLYKRRYTNAVDQLTNELPLGVKQQVIALAVDHGYNEQSDDIFITDASCSIY
ncbi:MAG: hypothetical protein HRT95_13135 [Moritella sp.]|uniref:hypothetical protein n=1 Tax=Moritella sp. TaxID=78556 RepID=UPI001D7DACA1|nr:hypothetical protein [Moritella sp.]NQZ51070.1 hypothetical protein [Moritella sp.]